MVARSNGLDLCPDKHVCVYYQQIGPSHLPDLASGFKLDLGLQAYVLTSHVVAMEFSSALLEELVHHAAEVDDFQRHPFLLTYFLNFL